MVSWLLHHRVMMSIVAYFLVALMLCSTVSPFSQKAEAAGEAVGMGLIIAILNAFGITVSSSGTISGMSSGLSDLMEQFSEQMYDNAQHFKDLFSAHITMAGWGIAKIGRVLTEAISSFISWLRSDKHLSPDNPINVGRGNTVIKINGISYPYIEVSDVKRNYSTWSMKYVGGVDEWKTITPPSKTTYNFISLPEYNSLFPNVYVTYNIGAYATSNDTGYFSFGIANSSGSNTGLAEFNPTHYRAGKINQYAIGVTDWYQGTDHYVALVGIQNEEHTPLVYGMSISITADNRICKVVSGATVEESDPGFIINDDNLNLDFLDDDGSTKDVYFTPALPDIVDQDLSTVGGLSDAAEQQLEYTYDLTGTAEISGTMDTTSDLEPGSGGSGNVPPIIIPSGGWFSSIWHYVVKALQDSAQGVAFIMKLVTEFIPPQLLNLCWASAVLCITFGIVNKFLK